MLLYNPETGTGLHSETGSARVTPGTGPGMGGVREGLGRSLGALKSFCVTYCGVACF